MRQKGYMAIVVAVALILIIAAGVIGFLASQNIALRRQAATPAPSSSPAASIIPAPTLLGTPISSVKPGWKVYKNTQYGFEFSYPQNYQVLSDSNNLYGWPKAILLLYKGGQSYDMPVEVWNSEAEYKAKYNSSFDVTAYEVGGKFVTFLNQNKTAEVAEIISTFKLTQ